MISNITIGQYYPADSFIHRLDPRTKLAAVLIYITILFAVQNVYGYVLSAICLALVIYLSSVPIKYLFKGLRMIIFLLLFTTMLNVFFEPGETIIFSFWRITVTLEGIFVAIKFSARLIMLVVGASLLTLTTTPIQLTDAIEYFLNPLKKIGVPAHEISMMMSIALRFIPTLVEEMEKIMKAQMARGADFDTGGLIKKAKSLIPLLVPLFISSFRRADELAVAMESRCYRGSVGRTKMKRMSFASRDYKTFLGIMVFTLVIIFTNMFL